MDYLFADLLTREELLTILVERKLNIPNVQQMSHDELMRLYKMFALPLARRERHCVRSKLEYNTSNRPHLKNNSITSMETDESENTQLSPTSLVSTSEKPRLCGYKHINPFTDEYLSIATKRIKIAWS
ncbi:PREDICTED: uncharacterized protein LOC108979018 [Bactrocera latifrons]|uniref:Ashwin n=1 Tax=Bactrocera latifrons TaxID=174628 RepID=A0A0K8V4U2_BACLA|nr:PREDICTED: uncharacterized protein LOC108979018 [Bactrocera latifrons]